MHSANISSIQVLLMPTMTRNVSFESTTVFRRARNMWHQYHLRVIRILSLWERFLFVTKTIPFGLK